LIFHHHFIPSNNLNISFVFQYRLSIITFYNDNKIIIDNYVLKKIPKLIHVILILINVSVSCLSQNKTIYEPEKFIVDKLLNNHIVMLGEVHNQPIMHNVLINTIKVWLDKSMKSSEPANLTVILEEDSIFTHRLEDKNFLMDSVINLLLPYDYLENLEFFTDLKTLCFVIDSLNLKRKNKIEFNIRGFESNEYPQKESGREIDLWFVNQRDSLSGYSMISYIKKHPAENILIYYGGAHLIKDYVPKLDSASSLNYDETKGYYLAHYLAKTFGDDNVITIELCVSMNDDVFKDYFPDSTRSKIMVKRKDVPEKVFKFLIGLNVRPSISNRYNYFFFLSGEYMPNHQLCLIFSKTMIEKLQHFIFNLEQSEPTNKGRQSYFRMCLFIISGKWFKTSNEIQDWLLNTHYDGLEQFSSDFLKIQLFKNLQFDTSSNSVTRRILNNLGFLDFVLNNKFSPDSVQWFNEIWVPETVNQLKCLNCIGIYWIGNEFEKAAAKKYLLEYTGMNYSNPDEYFIWYRHKIGLNY